MAQALPGRILLPSASGQPLESRHLALSSACSLLAPCTRIPQRAQLTVASSKPRSFKPAAATSAGAASAPATTASLATEAPLNPELGRSPAESPAQGALDLSLACPICHQPFDGQGATNYSLAAASRTKFACRGCRRSYASAEGFVDTVISSGAKDYLEPDLGWGGSSTFRNPLVSFVYERGWRQGFSGAGFPGPDEEWRMARDALKPAEGSTVVDLSCGSGLFTRRMAASGLYPRVVAVDFSEAMMRQTKEFIQSSPGLPRDRIALIRADVARLPFATGSVSGIHAGAALHCWPAPHLAVAEVSRVLRPGGVFVATTFLSPSLPFGDELVKPFRKAAVSRSRVYKYWEPEELQELCEMSGLVNYESQRQGMFMFLSAKRQ